MAEEFDIVDEGDSPYEDKISKVRILSGKYNGVELFFGDLKFTENPPTVKYKYEVVKSAGCDVHSTDFKQCINELLNEVLERVYCR